MTNARPNVLSLAVTVAISSSIIASQALAERRLQTKSVDITGTGHAEFTHSEVMVQPTLGDDLQPIPKSCTTTYPDQTQARAGYDVPSEGFTDVLSGIDGGVSTVDLFETDKNDVARKYTKVLKVGNEGIFKFTHNLAEERLVIEVRDKMTHQDSIAAVRARLDDQRILEPLTKVASPEHLAAVLKGANERAGNLGEADDYAVLATLEAGKVEVDGRTFMRLIAAGDQPPELQRLGQSLVVNDEVLLAAAISAYVQVHVLGEDLQQEALNKLFSYHKPVGYVVHTGDDTQTYPVSAGYPKLQVTEASGEVIVFHGQKQNPTDVAFVEGLFDIVVKANANTPATESLTQVKKDKFKNYQYVIRSRQMELLEKLVARHHITVNKAQPMTFALEDQVATLVLAFYETLQQALTSATADQADEFNFSIEHFRVAASLITPAWMHNQLAKHFSFKPALRDLLTNQHFVQNFLNLLPAAYVLKTDVSHEGELFASRVLSDIARQLIERENKLQELLAKEVELTQLRNRLKLTSEKTTISEKQKLIALQFKQQADNELEQLLNAMEEQQKELRKRREEEVPRIPEPEEQVADVRAEVIKARNTELTTEPGIENWDDTLPLAEQARLFSKKNFEINQSPATAGQPGEDSAAVPKILETLRATEKALEMIGLTINDDVYLRRQYISNNLQLYIRDYRQLAEEKARDILEVAEEKLNLQVNDKNDKTSGIREDTSLTEQESLDILTTLEETPNMKVSKEDGIEKRLARIFIILDKVDLSDEVLNEILDEIDSILWMHERKLHPDDKDVKRNRLLAHLHYKLEAPDPDKPAGEQGTHLLPAVEKILNIKLNKENDRAARIARVCSVLFGEDVSEAMLDQISQTLWKDDSTALNERDLNLSKLRAILEYRVEDSSLDKQTIEKQTSLLAAIENKLNIDISKSSAAKKRGKTFTVKLAKDLGVAFDMDDDLSDQKDTLRSKIQELIEKSDALYDDEATRRAWNNEIAYQLNIGDYKEDAPIENQNSVIETKLRQLEKELLNAGQPDVNERITAIENELDKHMALLGPKPRFVLDRELAVARRVLQKAESELTEVHRKLKVLARKPVVFESGRTDLNAIPDEDNKALVQAIKQIQTELDLNSVDEDTPEQQMEFIKDVLLGVSAEKRDETLKKLEAKTDLNIQIKGDFSLRDEADSSITIRAYVHTSGRDDTDQFDEALGELPLIRKKYAQITEFLHEHHKKSMEVAYARHEERNTQEYLNLKKQEMIHSENVDEKARTLHENEIARLNIALKQKSDAVSKAQELLTDFHKAALDATEEALGLKPDFTDSCEQRVNALRSQHVELGGHDGTGGKIWQLTQEQARLEGEIKTREADIERMKEDLKVAEQAVENDGGPFQFTPRQVTVLSRIQDFMQQHTLKKQALEAAIGLTELAVKSGKPELWFTTFNFDDELAPFHLQGLVGDGLAVGQASRIVKVFRSLKKTFPALHSFPVHPEPLEFQPAKVLSNIQGLVNEARDELQNGAQEYDQVISGMGKTAIHFVEHEAKGQEGFPEYFANRYASSNRIIALVREGLISKIELENHMKAVRGVDGYQTVDEFEHFLGYKHGVNLPHLNAVILMLSDKGAEEFMQIAFTPVTVTATGPAGMKESVVGMKEYAAAVIANYILDDMAFDNGRRTAAFLTHVQNTLTPYANAAGLSESDLIMALNDTLMQAHAAALEHQLTDYWVKPSASLVQVVTWYFSSYKPLLVTRTALEAARLSLTNMWYLYLLDLTHRGDYLHRMLTPFQHWLEHYGVDLDRRRQYASHSSIEQISEVGGLAMPLGKAASSVILLQTGSMLFARQYNANPHSYRSISRLVPEIVKSMGSGQGVQVPLLNRVTPQKVKTLASAAAALVLGPVATVGAYAHGLISGFTYAQTFGFTLASSLTFDFFMNDNKMLTQWLGGPVGRSLDNVKRWRCAIKTRNKCAKPKAIALPQSFNETDEEYANRVKANNAVPGWTRHENYLQFRERRDRTMKLSEKSWEKYFRENVPKWSFSHAESIPYSYTLGVFYDWKAAATDHEVGKFDPDKNKNTRNEL
ncbi:hypothetical protein [Endozoicomonas sp. 8E]|uniref:hypothetical protein n=1 Tax=Endozoicomonas sp. 8E TaxID=3035692 RepID=UPI002938E3CA|nr:hypothetical protein [Endozoicomonas sp. 8E]WOG29559.1 hypothetical protein P6910_07885 [Endozoicomonas sp. 8E]